MACVRVRGAALFGWIAVAAAPFPAAAKHYVLKATPENVQWGWLDPKTVATNFNLPGKEFPTIGALAGEFPEGHVEYFKLDVKNKRTEFAPGIVLPLRPFPGTLAVGIDPDDPSPRKGGAKDPMAPVSTIRPWKNGSNMDINELQEGSTIYIPVFLKGGLIWTGDSHCLQGNGEVNLTALECS